MSLRLRVNDCAFGTMMEQNELLQFFITAQVGCVGHTLLGTKATGCSIQCNGPLKYSHIPCTWHIRVYLGEGQCLSKAKEVPRAKPY